MMTFERLIEEGRLRHADTILAELCGYTVSQRTHELTSDLTLCVLKNDKVVTEQRLSPQEGMYRPSLITDTLDALLRQVIPTYTASFIDARNNLPLPSRCTTVISISGEVQLMRFELWVNADTKLTVSPETHYADAAVNYCMTWLALHNACRINGISINE